MKKSLLSILTLALVAVGCQNYDDQFDSLNTQITALTTKVDGLPPDTSAAITAINNAITALQTTVGTLGTSDLTSADLTTSLVEVLQQIAAVKVDLALVDTQVASNITGIQGVSTSVADLTTQLTDVQSAQLTEAQVTAIVAVTDQTTALTAVQESLNELLAADAALVGDLNIRNSAELLFAQSRIDVDSANDYILQGNLTVNTTIANSFPDVAAATTAINLLTAKITNVVGNVAITSASDVATGTIDITKLVYVSGTFAVVGSWNADTTVLTTAVTSFSVPINSAHPNFVLSRLIAGGAVTLVDDTDANAVSPTVVDLSACTGCTSVITAVNTLLLPGAAVNLGTGGPAKFTTVGSLISTSAAVVVAGSKIIAVANTDTGADGSVSMNPLTVTDAFIYATGPVTLDNGKAGSSLNGTVIFATGAIKVDAILVAGSASTISNTLSEANITFAAKDIGEATFVASGTGQVDLRVMDDNTAGALIATAVEVNVSGLVTNTATLAINGDTDIQVPLLKAIPETITASAANIFYAPLAVTTAGKAIDLKNGVKSTGVLGPKITLKSVTNINSLADIATMSELTILEQAGTVDLDLDTAVLMTTLNYAGKLISTAGGAGNENDVDFTVTTASSLTTVNLSGGIAIANFKGVGITTVSTAGNIRNFTLDSDAADTAPVGVSTLTDLTIGHAGTTVGAAGVVSITNTGIAALDLSSVSHIAQLHVTGNVSMTSMKFPSGVTTATNVLGFIMKTVTITTNGLDGVLSGGSSRTASSAYVEASFSGLGLTGAKTWLTFINNENTYYAGATGIVSFTIEIDDASAAITAAGADVATNCATNGLCTKIWGTGAFINELDELGLLTD